MTGDSAYQVSYGLDDVLEILRAGGSRKLRGPRPLPAAVLDDFLLSGRLNSVLGLDGFRIFTARLRGTLARAHAGGDWTGATPAELLEALLHSGVHYADAHRPPHLPALESDARRRAAFRHLAKVFAAVPYADFATLAARGKAARGRWLHVEPGDSAALRALAGDARRCAPVDAAKAALLALAPAELHAICRARGVAPARSLDATAARLVAHCQGDVSAYAPVPAGRRTFVLRDRDLATGDDVVRLDAYLRAVAPALGDDLRAFVAPRCRAPWRAAAGRA